MRTDRTFVFASVSTVVAVVGASAESRASFHFMQVEQVIMGVNGDTTAQAIQLRQRFSFQNQMQQSRVRAWNSAGQSPIIVATFSGPVPGFDDGDRILIASPSFLATTTPPTVPDRLMTTTIPQSYLAAGRLTFEDTFGTVYWLLAWGGSNYTGSTSGDFTNDGDGQFGPPFPGPAPTDGTSAMLFLNDNFAPSTNNAADYALTEGPAVFTNNAGATFTITTASNCGSADFDGDGDTGTDSDIEAFFACLGGNCCPTCGSADFDGDGDTGTDSDIEAFFRVLGGGTC